MSRDILQDHASTPMISALMVTQPGRETLSRISMMDFARQDHPHRELVVVHDGRADHHRRLTAMASRFSRDLIRVVHTGPGQTLGALRNLAVQSALGEYVCQWDDDDRHHPQRLAIQWNALQEHQGEACFLCDQLHLFVKTAELYWDDWTAEAYPFNLVQGTIMARRECLPAYRDIGRGEDTQLLIDLLEKEARICRVKGAGWCYVYVHHDSNVWSEGHHRAISRAKALGPAALLQRYAMLKKRLSEYEPPLGPVRLVSSQGTLF